MSSRSVYYPSLDGLRAAAILIVVVQHFNWFGLMWYGQTGVAVFFTLSGFLITKIVLSEQVRGTQGWLRSFYITRLLRLYPALIVMVATVGALNAAGLPMGIDMTIALVSLGYVMNFYIAGVAGGAWNGLGQTWTLAIEEQFYLVWPAVVLLVGKVAGRRGVVAVAITGALASVVWLAETGASLLWTTSQAFPLMVGAALALRTVPVRRLRTSGHSSLIWVALIVAYAFLAPMLPPIVSLAVPLMSARVIWVCVQSDNPVLGSKPLVWLGRRSYSLYLWHYPIAWVLVHSNWGNLPGVGRWGVAVGGLALSLIVTVLSWRFVEEPCLKLKDRIGGRQSRISDNRSISTQPAYEVIFSRSGAAPSVRRPPAPPKFVPGTPRSPAVAVR